MKVIRQKRRFGAGRQYVAIVLLTGLILLGLGLQPVRAQGWPTTKFVIKNDNPDASLNLPDWVPGGGFSDEQEPVIRDFEKYLGEVAAYYESMGFRAPNLPMTTNDNGDPAYIAYVYEFPPGKRGTTAKAGYFSDGRSDLRVDLSRAIVNGKPSERVYEDLAHELFHNVQSAYQSAYALDHGNWIIEGQAQAVGMDTAYKLRGVMRFKTRNQAYRLGGRPYYKPLAAATGGDAYRTSSFWRYVGEHFAASKRRQHAGAKPIAADYGYLAKVFRHPFKGPKSTTADLRWLDNALERELGLGLNRLYANFITTFAEYVPTRLNKMSGTPEEAAATWRKYIFGGCKVVRLELPLVPTGRIGLELDRNAAGCFIVRAQGVISSGWIDIAISARSGSRAALAALHIGTDGGQKVGGPRIVGMSQSGGGGYLGHWRFRIRKGQDQVFVISNVAEHAEKSRHQKAVLDLTASTWLSSMTQPIPQKAPVKKKAPKAKPAKQAKTAAADTKPDDEAADLDFLTATSALGTDVSMESYNPGCDEPFRFKPCGPTLAIGLSLTPGSLVASDLLRTGSTGSWVGQIRNMATSRTAIVEGYGAYADRVSQMEGAHVSIEVPNVSYGFTGSFDNALITVSGRDDTRFVSIGPENAIPNAMQPHYPLSGHVTIEEFTPIVLRGRFSAQLVDMDRVEPGTQTLPVHRTIEGQFVITSPWEGDPDIKRMVPSKKAAIQSLTEAFPFAFGGGLEDLARRHDVPVPPGGFGGGSDGGAGGSGAGSSSGATFTRVRSCDCSCQPLESYSAYCRPICAVKVRYCRVNAVQVAAWPLSVSEAQSVEARKRARKARVAALSGADRSTYLGYLMILGIAQSTARISSGAEIGAEPTRAQFQSFLKKMDVDEDKMGTLLDFFDQEHPAQVP